VTINGTVAQFSCKQNIPKTLWDVKGNKAKGKSREARDINLALDNIKAQIIKHYQRISDREAFVTAEMVRNAYQGIGSEYETLLKAFDRENEVFKKRVGKDRVMATYRARVRARNHVAAFIKSFYRRSDMSMLELTPDFIKEFAAYLSTEAGLRNGSIWANCMWLKGVVMKAHYNGLIPRNPFIQFHISPNVKEREYLTEDELKAVMTHEFADSKLAYIRDIFIFASFTALSFVDIQELTNDNIVEVNGEKWILSKRHKTNVTDVCELAVCKLMCHDRFQFILRQIFPFFHIGADMKLDERIARYQPVIMRFHDHAFQPHTVCPYRTVPQSGFSREVCGELLDEIGSKFQHGHIAASVKRLDKGGYMVSCPYTCPIGSHYPVFAYPFLEHFVLTVECF
jgi:hypothetical protein